MRNDQRLSLRDIHKKFRNPILNRYTPPGSWETILLGERKKSPNNEVSNIQAISYE